MFEITLGIIIFIFGTTIMIISSNKAVHHSIKLASAIGISPLIIGLVFVGIGTNLPEIFNSIISCAWGHGNIDAGDSIGSVLAQITLVLGLIPIVGRSHFKVDRNEMLIMGGSLIISLFFVFSVIEKGFITRTNALFLVLSMPIYMMITKIYSGTKPLEDIQKEMKEPHMKSKYYHLLIAMIGFILVGLGAFVVIQAILLLSAAYTIPEFTISFFLAAIGTSLPELVVDLTALRKKEYKLLIGDIIGSCIIDASLSIGIGQLFFPQAVSANLAYISILYTIFAATMVILLVVIRKKVDRKVGIIFLVIYGLSYLTLLI